MSNCREINGLEYPLKVQVELEFESESLLRDAIGDLNRRNSTSAMDELRMILQGKL